MDAENLVVFVTTPVGEVPARIATALVSEGLAACVNILPEIRSVYRWKGALEDDGEQMLIIKTTADRYPELERRIQALHPYEVEEIIALPVTRGSPAYLDWVSAQCRPSHPRSAT